MELIETTGKNKSATITFNDFKNEVLKDYELANLSRQLSLLGRKETLNGKAKFGIFGDGKEIAQIAFAKFFKEGDWRAGYYRDQTFMMATGMLTAEEYFAQLYGNTDKTKNPGNAGRSFNNHFATSSLNEDGTWKDLTKQKNCSPDSSPTGSQMPRVLGLAYASKLFRLNDELKDFKNFSNKGNEVAFCTIGDSSTSEGHFFEVLNAAGIMQVPLALAVWDDGYGISVPKEEQTIKASISKALEGFRKQKGSNGILIYHAKGWDYPNLIKVFEEGIKRCREEHVPVLFHIDEMTQPQGHSTSGSHERYKSAERLAWEEEFDPIKKMREWILDYDILPQETLDKIEKDAEIKALEIRDKAWSNFTAPIKAERDELLSIIKNKNCFCKNDKIDKIAFIGSNLKNIPNPARKDIISAARKITRNLCVDCESREIILKRISVWLNKQNLLNFDRYNDKLYIDNEYSALNVEYNPPIFNENSPLVNGREIIRDNFHELFKKYPLLLTFGEDTGKLGDVNQCMEGLQEKFGELRVSDTGIRETSIIGTGIGLALRGFRPIAEIQYLDYLIYAIQTLSDDLATVHWRTKGEQMAPMIIRTRGHRFEGIWHAGSPLGMIINSLRGIYVCVPRNLTQAAGFYNTLLEGNDPALVIEPLNGYRLKERRPANLGEFKIPLGIPEILIPGKDITVVTYGSCVRIAEQAAMQLRELGISVELIDVQTLLPFDINHLITESIKKTNKVLFFDEDVPGGASAFMMQKVLEEQKAYQYLDSFPATLSAKEHRTAYTSDGDYFSKPSADDMVSKVYQIMRENAPGRFQAFIQ